MAKKKHKVLIVDDEPDILEFLSYNLEKEGYKVFTASDGKKGVKKAKKEKPDLILLDVMMPEMDGIEACIELRETNACKNSIIVFLTARSEEYSQLAGYEAGADDYILKPIKPKVLLRKLKALIKLGSKEKTEDIIKLNNFVINRKAYTVKFKTEEKILPKKEFELLFLLASEPERVFKREEILERVWGNEVVVVGRTIDVHIRKLRERYGDKSFKTIKGVGYKFSV